MSYACHGLERLMSRCHSAWLSYSRNRSPGASADAQRSLFLSGTLVRLCNPSGKRHASRVLSLSVSHHPRSHPRIASTALDVHPLQPRCPPNSARRPGTPLPSSRRQRTARFMSSTAPASTRSRPSPLALRWVPRTMCSSAASVIQALCTFFAVVDAREVPSHESTVACSPSRRRR